MISNLVCVAAGGAIGAVLRYVISDWMRIRWPTAFPLGTLTVNVLGCFLIGVLATFARNGSLSPHVRLLLSTGLLGALTTFSTFGLETITCFQQHNFALAAANIAANVLLGIGAVALAAWLYT